MAEFYALCAGPYLTAVESITDSNRSTVFVSADGSECNVLLKDVIKWLPPFRIAAVTAAFILLMISVVQTMRKYRTVVVEGQNWKMQLKELLNHNGFMLYVRMLGAVFFFFLIAFDPNNAFALYPSELYGLLTFGFFSIVLSQKFSIANHWQAAYLIIKGYSKPKIAKIQWAIQLFCLIGSITMSIPTKNLAFFQSQKFVLAIVCTTSAILNLVFGTWVFVENYKTKHLIRDSGTKKVLESLLFYSVMTMTLSTTVSICSILTVVCFIGGSRFKGAPVISAEEIQTSFILFPLVLCMAFGCYTMIFLSTWKVSTSSSQKQTVDKIKAVDVSAPTTTV